MDSKTVRYIFEEKYYPKVYHEKKREEFMKLVQGSMSVEHYERMFIELSKYVGSIIETEEERCRKFEKGLSKEICTLVTVVAARTNFSQLIITTLRVEESLEEDEPEEEQRQDTSINKHQRRE